MSTATPCPKCFCDVSRVVEARQSERQGLMRRRRQCINCDTRYTTLEITEERFEDMAKRAARFETVMTALADHVRAKP